MVSHILESLLRFPPLDGRTLLRTQGIRLGLTTVCLACGADHDCHLVQISVHGVPKLASFSDVVTTSVVWLADQGVNISLRRYQAYRTSGGETIVTVSQVFPFADLRAVSPLPAASKVPKAENLPEVPWSVADFAELPRLAFPVPIAMMNSCAEQPGSWVSSLTAYERAGVEVASGTGQLAGFGFSVRARFKRRNHPWETKWGAAGSNSNAYRITAETASAWHDALREAGEEPSPEG